MRPLLTLAVLLAAALPVAVALWLAGLVVGRGPVAAVGLLALSAALNTLWPLGGGNGAAGTLRSRLGQWEWTVDMDRNPWRGRLGAMEMAALVTGGFVVLVPLLAPVWRLLPARPGLDEAVSWVGVAALLLASWRMHRPELPLRRMVAELEAEEKAPAPGPDRLSRWVQALAGIAHPDGSLGHVGGIGALTPGLHEVLDAERLLRTAAARDVPGAARLHERCLGYLAAQALPSGGFPAYPGGGGRVELTVRAVEALGARLSPAERSAHRAFVQSCQRAPGRFGRSPWAPASDEATRWAERFPGS